MFWGLNLRTKEYVFMKLSTYQSHSQSLKAMNKLMMKIKLCTFARKQIVCKVTCEKWLKYGVHMTKA